MPRGERPLTRKNFLRHLEETGGLQLDSINVLDRAHYLTLWSRFGCYERKKVDAWIYRDRIAYEYWGHEASILPISHLPLGLRRMKSFPPEQWKKAAWWKHFDTPLASRRRVLRRLRREGPLESSDFAWQAHENARQPPEGPVMPQYKEDKRSLLLLWHLGRIAVSDRRHFRRIYDLAERVYPETKPASLAEYEESWLLRGLSGNGICSERHLLNYFTAPALKAPERKRVIRRLLESGRIVEVKVEDLRGPFFALPEHLSVIDEIPPPRGTHLICPFDSLLWQRRRAEDLLDFRYRIEIYTPQRKRKYGYYVLPILHDGRLVGRIDPKLHREEARLEIRNVFIEPGFEVTRAFERAVDECLEDLCAFLGASTVSSMTSSRWEER